MKAATNEQMRAIDRMTIEEFGIPGIVLMENAGIQTTKVIKEMLQDTVGKKVWVFAGTGNNGGDGFVIARHLQNSGAKVRIVIVGKENTIKGDAKTNFDILQRTNAEIAYIQGMKDFIPLRIGILGADLIVDALLGTGIKGEVTGEMAEAIRMINQSGKPVVSVDIPSGLNGDTGEICGVCVEATKTVTFGLPKVGLCLQLGSRIIGELVIADISIPREVLFRRRLPYHLISGSEIARLFTPRGLNTHKGTYGRVFVVAGSEGMTGAAALTSLAVIKSGAGLVILGIPESLNPIMEVKLTEVMTKPLPETSQKTVGLKAEDIILKTLDQMNVFIFGPGLSTHPEVAYLFEKIIGKIQIPMVLDADGLNIIAEKPQLLKEAKCPVIITPHPGELARIRKVSIGQIQKNRVKVAEETAREFGVIVVLKGNKTIIAEPGGNVYINPTGNPGMATGGTGDVLTGIIGGLIAQGFEPVLAAQAGVYLHGLAGDFAAREKGQRGLIAGDILEKLPHTIKELEES